MKRALIRDLTESAKTWNPRRVPDREFYYIDLSAVDNTSKSITAATATASSEAPSRARQLVAEGDVLVSTVRPNLNAVAVVPPELDGATASTGFTVLRPTAELDGRFLFHWVRSSEFIGDMVRKATGASYPAVSDRIVKDSHIPAPPLPEQRRIASILDHSDALRTKRRQVLTHLGALTQSIFTEMFGDVRSNQHGYDVATIDDISERVTDGEHKTPRRSESGLPLLSARNVRDGWIDFENTDFVDADEYAFLSRRIEPREGDVLISCSGTIGRVAQVRERNRFAMVRSAALVRPGPAVHPTFLERTLASPTLKSIMVAQANSSAQANLFQNQIKRLPVIVPPIALQQEFAERVARVGAVVDVAQQTTAAEDELFASLQSCVFRGEL